MGRRGVDVEGPNNGSSIEEVREHLVDLGVLLPVVAFGILFGIPEITLDPDQNAPQRRRARTATPRTS